MAAWKFLIVDEMAGVGGTNVEGVARTAYEQGCTIINLETGQSLSDGEFEEDFEDIEESPYEATSSEEEEEEN